jgi:epoxyqueuosine reductase
MPTDREILTEALAKSRDLGADVAGAVPAARLIDCPSAVAAGERGFETGRGTYIVLGLYHDPEKPELDLWTAGGGTPGDRILWDIGKELGRWLQEKYGIESRVIPYQVYGGGIYLKDAACMAGIGRMGKNNLVLVPGFGPRVRFRAVWIDLECPEPDVRPGEDPCAGCPEYCIRACPMDAFVTGRYSREQCLGRMTADKKSGRERIDHCRACELACPDGDEK